MQSFRQQNCSPSQIGQQSIASLGRTNQSNEIDVRIGDYFQILGIGRQVVTHDDSGIDSLKIDGLCNLVRLITMGGFCDLYGRVIEKRGPVIKHSDVPAENLRQTDEWLCVLGGAQDQKPVRAEYPDTA